MFRSARRPESAPRRSESRARAASRRRLAASSMTTQPTADALRAMAEHRGLKLVRSRKRTPGVGDYGKFGLTDASGKALLGIGDGGLTASADEIEQYLRGGTASSWKLSAEATPDAPVPRTRARRNEDEQRESESPVRRRGEPKLPARRAKETQPAQRRQDPPPPPRAKPLLRIVEPEPEPVPQLRIRRASPKDAEALKKLLAQLARHPIPKDIEARMKSLAQRGSGLVVAERGGLVGCCAWSALPTLQHGPLGRVTLVLVDEDNRRCGVGTALVESAKAALAKAGCETVEVMSDIMINNAHNFFRSLKFEQTSYRFVQPIEPR